MNVRRTVHRLARGVGLSLSLGLSSLGLLGGCAAPPPGTAASVDAGSSLGYYWQSISGHLALLHAARPVADWVADPATPAQLRERLELTQRLRDYAVAELHLPDNASYRRYADIGRRSVVWNVVAAPELSLMLETWCFPVTGCVGYRGYFDEAEARALGRKLEAVGLEVSVYGVPAYSTLGKLPSGLIPWFADPLLNTFIDDAPVEVARLVFHELAHQVVFAEGDTVFNESFATAVETLGAERWLAAHGSEGERSAYAAVQARRADFQALTLRSRQQLLDLYASGQPAEVLRARKAELFAALRAEHARLKAERWGGFAGYDGWFARSNNAALGVLAAYTSRVEAFRALHAREGGDFPRFYAAVARLAALAPAERAAALDLLQVPAASAAPH